MTVTESVDLRCKRDCPFHSSTGYGCDVNALFWHLDPCLSTVKRVLGTIEESEGKKAIAGSENNIFVVGANGGKIKIFARRPDGSLTPPVAWVSEGRLEFNVKPGQP